MIIRKIELNSPYREQMAIDCQYRGQGYGSKALAAIRKKTEMLQIMVKQIKKSYWGKSQYEEGNCGRKRPL